MRVYLNISFLLVGKYPEGQRPLSNFFFSALLGYCNTSWRSVSSGFSPSVRLEVVFAPLEIPPLEAVYSSVSVQCVDLGHNGDGEITPRWVLNTFFFSILKYLELYLTFNQIHLFSVYNSMLWSKSNNRATIAAIHI